ncbi:MAG: spondin domain-containing protein [Cyanobacteria bacterium P01_F01_bin.3]
MSLNQVTVTIDNAAPTAGTNLTPLWVGFHNGEFDTYDRGRPVSPGLESLAEDGDTALISQEFALSGLGDVDGTLGNAPIAPGASVRQTFNVDVSEGRFFNYASMVLPSNDTFIANGNPVVHEIFDEEGNFLGADILVTGSQALDAGTEVNDELPVNTAFFGQQTPNTGVDENGVVQLSEGFNPVGSGGILDDARFVNADFTAPDYQIARIRVSSNPSAQLSSALTAGQEPDGGGDPNASGFSEFVLNEFGDALSYRLTVSGLDFGQFVGDGSAQTEDTSDDVTRIHLHNAERGVNGGVAFGLIDLVAPAADGQDNDDLRITQNEDGSTTLEGIWELSDPALISLSEFVDDIQNAGSGEEIPLYWNIHTNGSPGGAIRGQLQGGLGGLPEDIVVSGRERETVVLGTNDSLTVNRRSRLSVNGNAVEVEPNAENVQIEVNRRGVIRGRDAIVGSEAIGSIHVTNLGTINGDVILGSGDDIYDSSRGIQRGAVIGGAGDDILSGGRRGGRSLLEGGIGSDTLNGGSGRDVFIFGSDLLEDVTVDADSIVGFGRNDRLDFREFFSAGGSIDAVNRDRGLLNIELSSGDTISVSGNVNAAFNQVARFA